MPILSTKLYVPPPRPQSVVRPRLLARLDAGLAGKLTLISAAAGSGKTTLASAWAAACGRPVAWLALDANDGDLVRFLAYLIAAFQTVAPGVGNSLLVALDAPQLPATEAVLTILLNDLTRLDTPVLLVLDDYHAIDSPAVDHALAFFITHLPTHIHLLIATRAAPRLPLARWRVRNQLVELRAADLRFTHEEAAAFLQQVMGLQLAAAEIAAIEARTEGWVAGLQLAALSLQRHDDPASFIASFAGNHQFVLDYLIEEVWQQQPVNVQTFLQQTAILDRLSGALCDALLDVPAGTGQAMLEYLEHANLFVVALDDQRRWYRYHHLFSDALRQRLARDHDAGEPVPAPVAALHLRASGWYEAHQLRAEAFQHAVAAGDIGSVERLIAAAGVSLYDLGSVGPIRTWIESLPRTVLATRPALWVTYAAVLLFGGQVLAVAAALDAAELALDAAEPAATPRDLCGRVAIMRATLAIMEHDSATIMAQSQRALAYLHADNAQDRTAATWTLGYAHQLQGERQVASRAYTTIIASEQPGLYTIAAISSLAQIQEADLDLVQASANYRRVLELAGDPPHLIACESHLGLARIAYQQNDLESAQRHAYQCLRLTRQIERIETHAACLLLIARLTVVQGDLPSARALLDDAERYARQHDFAFLMPQIASTQLLLALRTGDLAQAVSLAARYALPFGLVRVQLAQGDPVAALALLEPIYQHALARGWADEHLNVLVLQALAHWAAGTRAAAAHALDAALTLAAPGGCIRLFVDEGAPMRDLLRLAAARGVAPSYVSKLLAATSPDTKFQMPGHLPLVLGLPDETLSTREREVLGLIAQGLSNQAIGAQLFLALDTVKGHNRRIFAKLDARNRTTALARARELGLL